MWMMRLSLCRECSIAAALIIASGGARAGRLAIGEPGATLVDETTITVTFDANAPALRHVASGFLSLVNANTPDPPPALVRSLGPQLWKNAYHTNYERITADYQCPTVITTLSEHWGLPGSSPPPWQDDAAPSWNAWKSFCRDQVNTHLDQGFNPVWNVWNEPDGGSRWWHGPTGWLDLAKTYRAAYRSMRQAYIDHPAFGPEDMVIAAPGFADWSNAYRFQSGNDYWTGAPLEVGFDGFLQFCTDFDLECHVIMWHEFWEDHVFYIPQKASILRGLVENHMALHPELGVQRYYIDEMIHADWPHDMDYNLSPGHVATVLGLVESSGVDGAVRACWQDRFGYSGNINFSLDNIFDVQYCESPPGNPVLSPPPSYCHASPYSPRSQYWVHRYYADFQGPAATVEASYPPQAGFGTYDPALDTYQVLLGYSLAYGHQGGVPTYGFGSTRTTVTLAGLPIAPGLSHGSAKLTLLEIPPRGLDPLPEPLVVFEDRPVTLVGGALSWVLEPMQRGHAYIFQLTDVEPGPRAITPQLVH